MSVDDWARREAERYAHGDVYGDIQLAFRAGVAALADALPSDEAVEAVQKELAQHSNIANAANLRVVECACGETFEATVDGWHDFYRHGLPAALQAAIDAVTKEARND